MGRQRLKEKSSRESFTLNSDSERDRIIKAYLGEQSNKAEFIKSVLYDYIKNNGVNFGANISTKNSTKINNDVNFGTKNDTKINNDMKIGTKNNTNNFKIEISENDEEIIEIKKDCKAEEEESLNNALKGLGI